MLNSRFNLDFVASPIKAIEMASYNNYDMILMDINLGSGISGLYVTRQLRKMDQYKLTPIIAVTVHSLPGDREIIINAGCTEYISKPIDRKRFLALIDKYDNHFSHLFHFSHSELIEIKSLVG